jgi:hypothetical protein
MSEQNTPRPEGASTSTNEAWQEVGKQFQALGESLATAFRAAWTDEQNRKRVQDMRQGVEQMLNDVGKALDETAKSPQMQQARTEAKRAAESMRVAGEQTYQELRPQIVSALRQLNTELQKFVVRMESKSAESAKANGTPAEMPAAPVETPAPPVDQPIV